MGGSDQGEGSADGTTWRDWSSTVGVELTGPGEGWKAVVNRGESPAKDDSLVSV